MSSLSENMISAEFSSRASHADKLEHGEFLFNGFTELFNNHSSLGKIHQAVGSDQKLRILCYQLSEYPILIDAVKAAANQRQDFLERALCCSWLCFLIAVQLKFSVGATKEVFIAGLVHDIATSGSDHLAELSPIFSGDAASLSDHHNEAAHLVTTGRFLDSVPRLPDGIKSIVRSHHERFDGTGFPDGKVEQQLSVAQQILIVTNEVMEFCSKDLAAPFNITSIMPILKLNASVYFRPVYSAVITVIKPSDIKSIQYQRPVINAVLDMQNQLILRWPHLLKASAELMLLNGSPVVITLTQIARRAWMLVTTAGILSEDLSLWLSQQEEVEKNDDVDKTDKEGLELEILHELEVLLGELNTMILSYQQHLETLTQDSTVEMTDSKRSLLIDLCHSLGEQQETFDLDEFTILNMCD